MSVIATICARGGSTGLPGKNIRPLLGKPLVVYSIEQALECPSIDSVYVSTDSQDIADVARRAGAQVPFLRPAELASSTAPKIPVIQHLVDEIEKIGESVDVVVDLDPTSPLRDLADIEACLKLLDGDTDTVITAYESDKNPYFNMVEIGTEGLVQLSKKPAVPVTGRQSAPTVYAMNASIYVWHRHTLNKGLWAGRTRLHVMPRERSVDVDTLLDFKIVELLMKEKAGYVDR